MLIVLLFSACGVFHVACFLVSPHSSSLFFFAVLPISYTVGSPLFFQFSVTGTRAGAGGGFWQVEPVVVGGGGHPTSICDLGVNKFI